VWSGNLLSCGLKENYIKPVCLLLHSGAFDPLSESILGVWARTLSAGRDAFGGIEASKSTLFVKNFPSMLLNFAQGNPKIAPKVHTVVSNAAEGGSSPEADTSADLDQFSSNVATAYQERRLFVTIDGRLGLGLLSTGPDDAVYIFGGAEMPFIMRTEGAYSKLVCEFYIDDIMNGEVAEAMFHGERCKGPFDHQLLMNKLYDFESAPDDMRVLLQPMIAKSLHLAQSRLNKHDSIRVDIV